MFGECLANFRGAGLAAPHVVAQKFGEHAVAQQTFSDERRLVVGAIINNDPARRPVRLVQQATREGRQEAGLISNGANQKHTI